MVNQIDRRSFDIGASQNAQDNFYRVAAQLEALIDEHNRQVETAMSDYRAEGVSDEYQAKELRWKNAAGEVRTIINTLRSSLESNDATADSSLRRARAAVDSIG